MNNKYFLYFLLIAFVGGIITAFFIPISLNEKIKLIAAILVFGVIVAFKFKKQKK